MYIDEVIEEFDNYLDDVYLDYDIEGEDFLPSEILKTVGGEALYTEKLNNYIRDHYNIEYDSDTGEELFNPYQDEGL